MSSYDFVVSWTDACADKINEMQTNAKERRGTRIHASVEGMKRSAVATVIKDGEQMRLCLNSHP